MERAAQRHLAQGLAGFAGERLALEQVAVTGSVDGAARDQQPQRGEQHHHQLPQRAEEGEVRQGSQAKGGRGMDPQREGQASPAEVEQQARL